MKPLQYVGALGRSLLLVGMALAVLIPQTHTLCFQGCAEMCPTETGCICHNGTADCCLLGEAKPIPPAGCGCEECSEIELPNECYAISGPLQIKRYSETQVPNPQDSSLLPDDGSARVQRISPLRFENRFTSQIDKQISTTVIIC